MPFIPMGPMTKLMISREALNAEAASRVRAEIDALAFEFPQFVGKGLSVSDETRRPSAMFDVMMLTTLIAQRYSTHLDAVERENSKVEVLEGYLPYARMPDIDYATPVEDLPSEPAFKGFTPEPRKPKTPPTDDDI